MEWVVAAYNAGGTNLKRVTGYPNADFKKVKTVRPEAYGLAMKVKGFVKRIKAYDKAASSELKDKDKDTEISITEPEQQNLEKKDQLS